MKAKDISTATATATATKQGGGKKREGNGKALEWEERAHSWWGGVRFLLSSTTCPHHRLILLTNKGRARSKRQGNLSKEAANMPSRRWRNTSLLHHQFLKYYFQVKKNNPWHKFPFMCRHFPLIIIALNIKEP